MGGVGGAGSALEVGGLRPRVLCIPGLNDAAAPGSAARSDVSLCGKCRALPPSPSLDSRNAPPGGPCQRRFSARSRRGIRDRLPFSALALALPRVPAAPGHTPSGEVSPRTALPCVGAVTHGWGGARSGGKPGGNGPGRHRPTRTSAPPQWRHLRGGALRGAGCGSGSGGSSASGSPGTGGYHAARWASLSTGD